MPMNEPDDLLARSAPYKLGWYTSSDLKAMIADLRAALRVALAAQPQPLFQGTWFALAKALRGRLADTIDGWPKEPDEIVVYPAASAGSATPTGDDDE